MPRAYLSTSVVVMQVWLDASRLPVQSGFHDFKQSRCGRGSTPLSVAGRASSHPAPHIKAAPLTRRRAACLPRKMFCISSTLVGFLVMLTVQVVPITRRTLRDRDSERVSALFALANFLYGGASVMYLHVLYCFPKIDLRISFSAPSSRTALKPPLILNASVPFLNSALRCIAIT